MTSNMGLSEIRKEYLDFFASKEHAVIPSAKLIPENDPTTLFTGSGMQPMLPYLLGQKHPAGKRIADSQKCLRVQDIEDIGDNRHTTFFEMLGNWSLGDYFKEEQIPWMFEFLTDTETGLGLDPKRIYVTIFAGDNSIGIPKDTESAELWKTAFATKNITANVVDNAEINGMQGGRIFSYDEKKNWWSRAGVPSNMPVGEPGGPDTEMFWDVAPVGAPAVAGGLSEPIHANSAYANLPCHVNCDCGRFMEIGNNVFMQYIKTESGFAELPQRNVDFGGGLERLTAAVLDNPDVFQIDVFQEMITILERISGKKYADVDIQYFRIILDHIRAATFLLADGVFPSNKDQGYFTRRLLRRAIRFARLLGIEKPFVSELAQSVITSYEDAYQNLRKQQSTILSECTKEENKFLKTLQAGLLKINQDLQNRGSINGQQAFELYSTYGFPIEMILEEAQKLSKTVDVEGFHKEFHENMKMHQDLSRTASAGKFKGGLIDHSDMSVKYHTATHLLHKALKIVLGDHVEQKGSNITPERLRFDFSHPDKMTPEQIKQTEQITNEQIQRDLSVTHEEMSVAQAKEKGALGLFEHKYGDKVSVYTVGDFSCEICGGPHVEHTGTLGTFKITKEESASAGVRRIKAG